jgi:hypothetical protein
MSFPLKKLNEYLEINTRIAVATDMQVTMGVFYTVLPKL